MAHAGYVNGVVSLSANVVFLSPPPTSLSTNSLQSNTVVYGMVEKVDYELTQAQYVDLLYDGDPVLPGLIPVGTHINSYFLHFDPASGTALQNRTAGAASIEFPYYYRIVGLQFTIASLTSGVSGNLMLPSVGYETNNILRGLELVSALGIPADTFSLPNYHTLNFTLNSSAISLDEMRVLVATPEPSYALLLAPAIGLLMWRRRRTATKAPGTL
jgi:hypothetical protein